MENLLLLIHRIPYPPNKGDKIRSYHLLKHLAQRYRVHLGTFVDDADDWQHVAHVETFCAESHFAALNPTLARVRCLGALIGNRSLSLDYYRDAGLRHWVSDVMQRKKIDRILVFSSAMAQYADAYPQARRIVDFVDVDSDKWHQYSKKKSWPMSWLYRHESLQLLGHERRVAATYDASLFVSQPEAELFRQLAPESATSIGYFNNGVDTDYFSPAVGFANPYPAASHPIVFTGAMDYWPNVDAVEWFATAVFPQILAQVPAARFYIVGARPSATVQALARLPGITVTGTVADIRPYLAHADVAVAPLRVARGIQNKVLEAMAMKQLVVVSPQALEGIEAEPGIDLFLAADAAGFAQQVCKCVFERDTERDTAVRESARKRVEQHYSWPSNLARIDAMLESDAVGVHAGSSGQGAAEINRAAASTEAITPC